MKKFFVHLGLLCCFSIAMQAQCKTGTFGLQEQTGYAFNLIDTTINTPSHCLCLMTYKNTQPQSKQKMETTKTIGLIRPLE